MLLDHKKKLARTIIAAGMTTLFIAQPGAGFMLILAILPLIFWVPYSVYMAIAEPETRWLRTARVLAWVVAILISFAVHHARETAARHSAEELAANVDKFSARNGRCPSNIEEIGLNPRILHERPGRPIYSCNDGKQFLAYRDTMRPFGIYIYDFSSHTWNLRPD